MPETKAHNYAYHGKLDELKAHLSSNPNDVHEKDKYGCTPLHDAAKNSKLEAARLLIDRGGAVDCKNMNGYTPLHTAAAKGDLEIVRLLIDRGGAVDCKDNDGWTPLHTTARYGVLEIARLLVDRGGAVDTKDNDGKTPLDLALQYRQNDVANCLCEAMESKSRGREEEERKRKAAEEEERKRKAAEEEERKREAAEDEERKREAAEDERKQLQDIVSKIDRIIILQNTGGATTSSDGFVLDKKYKLTPQEAAENDFIANDPLLQSFNNCMQKGWNQSFIAASVIGTNHLSLQQNSKAVSILNVLSQISSSLPFASIIFSSAASVVNSINSVHKEIEFRNLAALVPTSDAVEMGILSSAIARHFTLSYHDEIKSSVYNKKSSNSFTRMKEVLAKATDAVDSKLARSFTCKDGLDWLAADMSRVCMSYIFNCNVLELSQLVVEVTKDRSAFTQRLVDLVKDTYPVSKPIVDIISQSSSGLTTTSGGGAGQVDSNIKYADSDEVRKLKETNKKQEEEIQRIRKVAEGTKSVVDAFIDTTGIGANGQVQAAMRTADGRVKVIVDNPVADQKLAAIAQVTEDNFNDHSEKINRQNEDIERLRKVIEKKNTGCCVIS